MKLLSKIFGSDKVVDGAMSAADKLFFTNEEKADYKIKLLKAYEPFKLAQRLIAGLVTSVYLFIHLIAAVMYVISFWLEKAKEVSEGLFTLNNDSLGTPFAIIVAWYFAGGVLNSIKKKN